MVGRGRARGRVSRGQIINQQFAFREVGSAFDTVVLGEVMPEVYQADDGGSRRGSVAVTR